MKLATAVVLFLFFSVSAMAKENRVSEACEAFIYAKIDKQLPANQFVTKIRQSPVAADQADLEITLDNGNENFCLKSGSVKFRDEDNGVCKVLQVYISTANFDCG